jgi:hypothetical protein
MLYHHGRTKEQTPFGKLLYYWADSSTLFSGMLCDFAGWTNGV